MVVVYGAVARRESAAKSDHDLFVVYPDGMSDDARADFSYQLAGHVERLTGNKAQVYSMERAEVAQRIAEDDPLIVNVLADGIPVFGSALRAASGKVA